MEWRNGGENVRWIFGQEEKLGENEMKKKVCGVRMCKNEVEIG